MDANAVANFIYFYRGVYQGLVRKSCLRQPSIRAGLSASPAPSDIGQTGSAIYSDLVSSSSSSLRCLMHTLLGQKQTSIGR